MASRQAPRQSKRVAAPLPAFSSATRRSCWGPSLSPQATTATRPHPVVRRLVSYLPRVPHANDDDRHHNEACQRVVCWSRQQKWCALEGLESPIEPSLTLPSVKCEGVRAVDGGPTLSLIVPQYYY